MNTVRLDAWENIISQQVNGAPLPAMIDAVRDACIEFCQKTKVDLRTVDGIEYLATSPEVTLPDSGNTVPWMASEIQCQGYIWKPITIAEAKNKLGGRWLTDRAMSLDQVGGFVSQSPGAVRLVPSPSVDLTLSAEVIYQPRRNSTDVAWFLYEYYADVIGYGAVARLHAHSAAGYAQPERADAYRQMFLSGLPVAASTLDGGFADLTLRTGRDRF
jgi:hypothetical protein